MVMDAVDYRIYQRRNGHAQVRFAGTLPADNAGKTGYVAARPLGKHPRLHGYWRCTSDAFVPHARHGVPMLSSFYNVPVEAPQSAAHAD